MAEGYWDYKRLVEECLFYLLPLGLCLFYLPSNFSKISKICLSVLPFIFIVLLPYIQLEAIGKILLIIPPFLIFWPKLPFLGRIYVLTFFFIVFVMGTLGARSTATRFVVALLFSLTLFFENIVYKNIFLKFAYFMLFLTPIVAFAFAATGVYNIFEISNKKYEGQYKVKGTYEEENEEDLSADTRTFLYVETIQSAIDNNTIGVPRSFETPISYKYYITELPDLILFICAFANSFYSLFYVFFPTE